jgi:hypothetical protein
MKTKEQLVSMQNKLRLSMMSLKASGAPPEIIGRSALGLASADDVLNWVLGKPSELARLEEEYDRVAPEINITNE